MARMRRGLVHAMAWSLATGAAVTLSWWGVHTVMAGTVYDPPRALPIPAGTSSDGPAGKVGDTPVSATQRPEPSSPTPSAGSGTGSTPPSSASATPSPGPTTPKPPASRPSQGGGSVKSYAVDGGLVAFDLGETSAELVSATPASGWQMQVWKQPTWIRVTFTKDGRELSVFCVWHDTAPRVEIEDR
ncbi:hypothetical protein ABZ958_22805 [Streptomyces sp. NPDC046237]|uniref:hypothetical protein n=1 Tax=Streptomyces sp. NPDC046237 TaxID=3154914 RepID=UPI0033F72EA4